MKLHWLTNLWPVTHPVYAGISENPPDGCAFTTNEAEADLVLAPTWPEYKGQKPWVVLIEDWVTLFHPDLGNGHTHAVNPFAPGFGDALREKFAKPNFKGIVCHHPGTFRDLRTLNLTDKIHYFPIGIPRREPNSIGHKAMVSFVFLNSWGQGAMNFNNRGGQIVVRAVQQLMLSRADFEVVLLCGLNLEEPMQKWATTCPRIRWVSNSFIPQPKFDSLLRTCDCLLLPSHRVHAHTIVNAMSYGMPAIVSDGWGNDCYVQDGFNGVVVPGIKGHTSFEREGLFRENYPAEAETYRASVELSDRMEDMIRDRVWLQQLGARAHEFCNAVHSVGRQKHCVGRIFKECCR